MCVIYLLRIILLLNKIRVRNFRRFGWNKNFLTTKISQITVYVHVCSGIPYNWKFSPSENFCQFHHQLLLAKFLSTNFLSCDNDYVEDMVTFYCVDKNLFHEYFYNAKVDVTGRAWQNFWLCGRYIKFNATC